MCNLWTVYVRDGRGNITTFAVRGPEGPIAARGPVEHILYTMRQRAIESGADDPELQIVDVKPIGEDFESAPGQWQPVGAKPVNLNRYAKSEEVELIF